MREIKFRGLNDYGWHVGHLLISYRDRAYIVTDMIDDDYANVKRSQEVELSTVGQYTGLKDENGIEIYEGDILEFEDTGEEGYEYLEGYDFTNRAAVCYENGRFELENFAGGDGYVLESMSSECHEELMITFNNSKVIGNRFENPELLEARE